MSKAPDCLAALFGFSLFTLSSLAAADLPAAPSLGALGRWSKALAQTSRTVDHPFNAGLMLEALVAEARNTLNSRH